MQDPQQRRITVEFVGGRKRYYGPGGKEVRAEKVQAWLAYGLLEAIDPGLLGDQPQSYRFRSDARPAAL